MEKEEIRKHVWDLVEARNVARFPRPVHGRIPNFEGSEIAAERLKELPEWSQARVIKANPDSPQRPCRELALRAGKVVYMAVPRLRQEKCFVELDPRFITSFREASTIEGAFKRGRLVGVHEMKHVDLVMAGSVAVNEDGGRVGKGGGYSDLEYAITRELGIVSDSTAIVTTVHPLQILHHEIPMKIHDIPVDYVVTPAGPVATSRRYTKPHGIYWDLLPQEKMDSIPILRKLMSRHIEERGSGKRQVSERE